MALEREQILARLEAGDGQRDLSGLDLSGADLSRLDLRGVNLSRADMSSADLRWAILEGADLHSSVLRRADARWAIFRGANLRQADLVRTNMGWADITDADLTGADMDGANLENVNLGDGIIERRVPTREWVLGGLTGDLALPQAGGLAVAASILGGLGLVHIWGWLFNRHYFGAFGLLDKPGVVSLVDRANLNAGLLKVALLTLKTLLFSPLILIALGVMLGVLAAVTMALVLVGERLLDRVELARPQARPLVMVGIFVVYALLFWLTIGPVTAWAGEHWEQALPGDKALSSIFRLFSIGGWLTKLGLLVVLAAAGLLLWVGWRWLSNWLTRYELPTEWRLRYPALNGALVAARASPLFARNAPLTDEERRRALYSAAGGLLLLATLLTGVGRVYALQDMCDGGDLPRVQLYTNREPTTPLDESLMCERLIAETDDAFYVFFPSQTEDGTELAERHAKVHSVPSRQVVHVGRAEGDEHNCPTCESEAPDEGERAGIEQVYIDEDEVTTEGVVQDRTADLVLLAVPPDEIGSVKLLATTKIIDENDEVATNQSLIQPGVAVQAVGYLSTDGTILEARQLSIIPREKLAYQPEIEVDLSGAPTITISGSGWRPGSEISLGLGRTDRYPPAPEIPLSARPIIAGTDGTFSAPMTIDPAIEAGPDWQVVARDPPNGLVATGPWLAEPLPTATPSPTRARAASPPEETPSPGETPKATGTLGAVATNTPFPTAANIPTGRPIPGTADCDPDEFEQDWPRGFEKEIYVSFSENAVTQSHNFCGYGIRGPGYDIDLAFFHVKKGRWYRVFTTNLAPGVDTVMAVGDLGDSTPCDPPGCWNDDRGALTYESEIVFQAINDARAMITVDNRGSHYGTDATYELGVAEFIATPTPTHTTEPSKTPTATPTATETPYPLIDRCESNDSCRYAGESCVLGVGTTIYATLHRGSDEDWYETVELAPPGTYRLTLDPPDDQNFDLELRRIDKQSTNDCPLADPFVAQGYTDGDATELIEWTANANMTYVVRVFTPYTSVYGDPHHYYRLTLECTANCETPTPTLTGTPTTTSTPTITPSVTTSPSATVSTTVTVTATSTVTATGTVTITATSTATTASPAASATATATATITPTVPFANPASGTRGGAEPDSGLGAPARGDAACFTDHHRHPSVVAARHPAPPGSRPARRQ